MKGDFSRLEENNNKHYSRVLMQQGRVLLDRDWNEQSSILLHYLQTLAKDLIGDHAGPDNGFEITVDNNQPGKPQLIITHGRYYVDGILCENDEDTNYFKQPYYPLERKDNFQFPAAFLAYLDVWERHVTCFEDENLCEIALGGIDTTTRAQVVWQIKLRELTTDQAGKDCKDIPLPVGSSACLRAQSQTPQTSDDPCNIEPDARYRGAENQLYRVEIHTGNIDEETQEPLDVEPTFKWSRENGSVVFPVNSIVQGNDTTEVRLANLGRDDKFGLLEGDWVELSDDAYTLHNRAGRLLQIVSIDRDEMSVSLNGTPEFTINEDSASHPLLRRWDQKAGDPKKGGLTLNADDKAANIEEGNWLTLEDGIQIQFEEMNKENPEGGNPEGGSPDKEKTVYRTGDYWLIPARTATGNIEWAKDNQGKPAAQPPLGIKHHYAPLGIFSQMIPRTPSCRRSLKSALESPPAIKSKGKNP
jgi:hypothetical protein